VPASFDILYTSQSSETAGQVARMIEEVAKSLDIQEFAEVVQTVEERAR
jgi:hypothetical protein